MRYQCSVREVLGHQVTVTYHCTGRTSVEMAIDIPSDRTPTPRWIERQMRRKADEACGIWEARDQAKIDANRLDNWDIGALNGAYVNDETGDGDVVDV